MSGRLRQVAVQLEQRVLRCRNGRLNLLRRSGLCSACAGPFAVRRVLGTLDTDFPSQPRWSVVAPQALPGVLLLIFITVVFILIILLVVVLVTRCTTFTSI